MMNRTVGIRMHRLLTTAVSRQSQKRFLWSQPFPDAVVHPRGDLPYGMREYVLLPPHLTLYDVENDDSLKIASLHAHRNILFGAKTYQNEYTLAQLCPPLVDAALHDAQEQGEQPQAVSTLHGLCDYVVDCLEGRQESKALDKIRDDDPVVYEAVKAIATGQPRPGHSVVGVGTFRDGQSGWELLAKEYVQTNNTSDECQLYKSVGAELIGIEHLAETSNEYLKSAGGAMARFFFI